MQCMKCKLFMSLGKTEHVKCKGRCAGTFHKNCVKDMQRFLKDEACEECVRRTPSGRLSKIDVNPGTVTVEQLLLEVNGKLEAVYGKLEIVASIHQQLEEIKSTVDFYAEKYQELVQFKEDSTERIKRMEVKVREVQNKNIYLEKCNLALEERIDAIEIKGKENCIEVIGLMEVEGEKLEEIIPNLGAIYGLQKQEIESAWRVGGIIKRDTEGNQQKKTGARPVVVKMISRAARDRWLAARKMPIHNNDVYGGDKGAPIYINENLTKKTRDLLKTVKDRLRGSFKYIWVKNGRVLIKNVKKTHCIRSLQDIELYVPKAT